MSISLLGFPWDASSSYARGAALAPDVVRALLFSEASSPYSIDGVDLSAGFDDQRFAPLPARPAEARAAISATVADVLGGGRRPLSVGGDHSISYPILAAVKAAIGPVNVLHIDAHGDLYDEYVGERYSHACPFARALEDGCIANLVQVGIRSVTPDQRALSRRHGGVMLRADQCDQLPYDRLSGLTYVSIDLDGLDPAFAPGVSHPEPGGLTTREVLAMIATVPGPIVGADVVELNPERDVGLQTAGVAVRLLKELAARMLTVVTAP
jgi:agmatinase